MIKTFLLLKNSLIIYTKLKPRAYKKLNHDIKTAKLTPYGSILFKRVMILLFVLVFNQSCKQNKKKKKKVRNQSHQFFTSFPIQYNKINKYRSSQPLWLLKMQGNFNNTKNK